MALPLFTSFYPTTVKWINAAFNVKELRVIRDNRTGAPVGLVSPNANGPEGIWAPTPLTSDQIANPTTEIIADINATYQLDEAPYSRYYSDGTDLLPLGGGGGTVIPPGINVVWFSPISITEDYPVVIQGGVRVIE